MSHVVYTSSRTSFSLCLRDVKTNAKEIHDFYIEIRLAHAFIGEKILFPDKKIQRNVACNLVSKPIPYFPSVLGEKE